ncbi:MAG: hypothetical protein K2M90_03910 [Treponemataceae bacterium]|nr:hypothetical protein [Treponemataceae bacterium]MDE7391594.1 hypothetical protein [Treponemataceae bacterium]
MEFTEQFLPRFAVFWRDLLLFFFLNGYSIEEVVDAAVGFFCVRVFLCNVRAFCPG